MYVFNVSLGFCVVYPYSCVVVNDFARDILFVCLVAFQPSGVWLVWVNVWDDEREVVAREKPCIFISWHSVPPSIFCWLAGFGGCDSSFGMVGGVLLL